MEYSNIKTEPEMEIYEIIEVRDGTELVLQNIPGTSNQQQNIEIIEITDDNNQLFKCTKCDIMFQRADLYSKHWTATHSNNALTVGVQKKEKRSNSKKNKPHQCPVCDCAYSSPFGMRTHIRNQHTGERPYLCPTDCDERFAGYTSLKDHINQQHYNCILQCPVCNLQFNFDDINWYFQHYKDDHESKEELKYPCYLCDERFSDCSNLLVHFTTHPDECDEVENCPKEFLHCGQCNKVVLECKQLRHNCHR